MTYEELQAVFGEEVYIVEKDLSGVNGLKGLYVNGCVAIERSMTNKEKRCVLAEEIGHHLINAGDILDQTNTSNRKQELKARITAYNMLVGMEGIIDAYKAGCKNVNEAAEHLNVTEHFFNDAIAYYKQKYGMLTKFDGYVIYFEPSLGVMEFF